MSRSDYPLKVAVSGLESPRFVTHNFKIAEEREKAFIKNQSKPAQAIAIDQRHLFDAGLFEYSLAQGLSIRQQSVRKFNGWAEVGDPVTFFLLPIQNQFNSAWKYKALVETLKKQKTSESRLLLLVRWLNTEGVCAPDKLLPESVLASLLKHYKSYLHYGYPLFHSDRFYWFVVRTWEPYFVLLRSDVRKVRASGDDPYQKLQQAGFDSEAIQLVIKHKDLRTAIVMWMANRLHASPATIRNALSRAKTHRKLRKNRKRRRYSQN